ncbi:uncharacterized protein L969DRAFT_102638 [Mixia osmundae IAM 14324]|uniref:Uncharacterized protein n=1 Tax=Mixia osmundae (strain CBS 9802 / IAM 14324 / JCM 22182 / KY 12970) TaxID=764103 RepID=G7E9E7_MIXOS|nr:uncharacterized protein L969DRAFT_102638 [Mixia osmundae IAM 14324]KEI39896.1 hypothetical protein L969DRAFT_102638 [Mixia osmundae IAM 14324]GAA99266.1 hypothetical protein E5Q_05960 [Mixia osmundae IAM 14324]
MARQPSGADQATETYESLTADEVKQRLDEHEHGEISTLLDLLTEQLEALIASYRARTQSRLLLEQIPAEIRAMKMRDLAAFSWDMDAALKSRERGAQEPLGRSPKKVKSFLESLSSPFKTRQPSPTPAPVPSTSQLAQPTEQSLPKKATKRPSEAHLNGSPAKQPRVSSQDANTRTRTTGTATPSKRAPPGGFTYRARLSSALPAQAPPVTISTPSTSTSRSGESRLLTHTVKRRPKKDESIMAFSVNGSPLGVLDLQGGSDDEDMDDTFMLEQRSPQQAWQMVDDDTPSDPAGQPKTQSKAGAFFNGLSPKKSAESLLRKHPSRIPSPVKGVVPQGNVKAKANAFAASMTSRLPVSPNKLRRPASKQATMPPAVSTSANEASTTLAAMRRQLQAVNMAEDDRKKMQGLIDLLERTQQGIATT